MRLLTTLSFGLLVAGSVHAQLNTSADALLEIEEAEQVRRYTFEVIVFSYNEDVSVGNEIFLPERIEPEPDTDETLTDDPDSAGDAPDIASVADMTGDGLPGEGDPIVPFEYETLDEDALTLTDTLRRLELLDAYEPLMHFGWTQTTIPEDQTPTLPLARFGELPPGLDGTLKLYLSRFLHLVVDVSLAADDDIDSTSEFGRFDEPVAVYRDERQVDAFEFDTFAPLRYSISEDRIVKNGETRYYDHPKFGVVAKVIRVEEEPSDAVDAEALELATP